MEDNRVSHPFLTITYSVLPTSLIDGSIVIIIITMV